MLQRQEDAITKQIVLSLEFNVMVHESLVFQHEKDVS